MKNNDIETGATLAIYPNAQGFGYVYMAGQRKLLDYGVTRVRPLTNKRVFERIKKSIDYLQPAILIFQDPYGKSSRTGERVKKLIKKVVDLAKSENLDVHQYSRDQIRFVFEQMGAKTKNEIAEQLATEFTELKDKVPKIRQLWEGDDRNMAIFNSLSLIVTHRHCSSS